MFKQICQMPQKTLKDYLARKLNETHDQIFVEDGFVYAQGEFPVLLVAHLDTVHKTLPKTFKYDVILDALSSPEGIGGDDRCGVYMILQVLKHYNCSVLFCEDEEIGGIGAQKFVETKLADELEFNYIIEFDRKGSKDAVFYNCDNPEFEKFITDGYYETNYGSFSDISTIAPALGCAAVNLSCGYYNAHTQSEFVILSEMENSIQEACAILNKTTENDKFEYVEGYDIYDDWFGYKTIGYEGIREQNCYIIGYYDKNYSEEYAEIYAMSDDEAIGKFCISHPSIPFDNVFCIDQDETL
jgi:hypothetical protein